MTGDIPGKSASGAGTAQFSVATVVVPACPICSTLIGGKHEVEAQDHFFGCINGTFGFVRCHTCACLVQNPRIADAALPLAYQNYYTHAPTGADDILAGAGGGIRARIKRGYVATRYRGSKRLGDQIGRLLYPLIAGDRIGTDAYYRYAPPTPSVLLDYGCGGGEYLRRMRGFGHEVTGVDFDPVALARIAEGGIPAFTPAEAESQPWEGRFDAITLAHVIEHVENPGTLLRRLHGWLRPGGTVFLETPSAQAEGLRVFGSYWRGLEAPRHLTIPSAEGLATLAHASGFVRTERIWRRSVRAWTWNESMAAVTEARREDARQRAAAAAAETVATAEFITMMLYKPA